MYDKNITSALLAFLDKEAPSQKVAQWRLDRRSRPCITKVKFRQLRRLYRYQIAAINGKMGGSFYD